MAQSSTRSGSGCLLRLGVILFIPLLLCGGIFFAYQIYDFTREAVVALGLPEIAGPPAPVIAAQPTRAPAPNISAGDRVNVLLLGVDRRPSEKCPCRTDTMMIASLDPKSLTAGLVTVPRDLYVPFQNVPNISEARINQAHWYGDLYKLPGGGPGLAKRTVEYNLGRRIHFYILVDFAGFIKVVDALGGIDLDVPKAIDDPQYPNMDFGYDPLYIPAGRVHMNGELALKYARTRHSGGDYDRMKRQIQVLMGIRDKALRLDMLTKLPTLVKSMWGIIETDLTPQDVLAYAPIAARVKTENIKAGSIDQTMTVQVRLDNGAVVLWPDRAKIGKLIDQVIPQNGATAGEQQKFISQEAARVLILNGTKNAQLAEQTAQYLQAQGFQVTGVGNADRVDYAKTTLIDYSGAKEWTINTLARLLRVEAANIRRTPNAKSEVDVRIILGADWSVPEK